MGKADQIGICWTIGVEVLILNPVLPVFLFYSGIFLFVLGWSFLLLVYSHLCAVYPISAPRLKCRQNGRTSS